MLINVSELITDPDFAEEYIYLQPDITIAQSGEEAGEAVVGANTQTPFTGIIQPAKLEDLEILPEGERDGDFIKVWSLMKIPAAAFVLYDNRQWKVVAHKDWIRNGYWQALAVDSPDAKN